MTINDYQIAGYIRMSYLSLIENGNFQFNSRPQQPWSSMKYPANCRSAEVRLMLDNIKKEQRISWTFSIGTYLSVTKSVKKKILLNVTNFVRKLHHRGVIL